MIISYILVLLFGMTVGYAVKPDNIVVNVEPMRVPTPENIVQARMIAGTDKYDISAAIKETELATKVSRGKRGPYMTKRKKAEMVNQFSESLNKRKRKK